MKFKSKYTAMIAAILLATQSASFSHHSCLLPSTTILSEESDWVTIEVNKIVK